MKYLRHEAGIKKFAQRLKEIRLKKNISQEELAFKAGLEFSQVSRIERGIIKTSISHLFALADALKKQPSELLNFNLEES